MRALSRSASASSCCATASGRLLEYVTPSFWSHPALSAIAETFACERPCNGLMMG